MTNMGKPKPGPAFPHDEVPWPQRRTEMGGERYQTGAGSIFTFALIVGGVGLLVCLSLALLVGMIPLSWSVGRPWNAIILEAWLAFAIWFMRPHA